MSNAKDLREHAGRLVALANRFREQGQSVYAEMLAAKAGQTLEQAVSVEMAYGRAARAEKRAQGADGDRF
jgi:hypothetical protein